MRGRLVNYIKRGRSLTAYPRPFYDTPHSMSYKQTPEAPVPEAGYEQVRRYGMGTM